jgi:ubiquinone/menaquinone biosynthesis C-methylase UbiE
MSMDLLKPAYNDVLLDMSCGSGLFSRRFAASRHFAGVIAADYSESMLKQVRETFDSSGAVDDG